MGRGYRDRWAAQRACQQWAEPGAWGDDITWQLGEPVYWYQVENAGSQGFNVVRYEAGEVPHEKFGSVPF
jgi:hypothetical protein